MTPVASQIEAWLIQQTDWISEAALCERFDINERQLRYIGTTPGLISHFSISSPRGYKHVRNATRMEYLKFCHSEKRSGITRFRRLRILSRVRHNVLEPTIPFLTEADTGQGIML